MTVSHLSEGKRLKYYNITLCLPIVKAYPPISLCIFFCIDPLQESAIWVDESQFFERRMKDSSRPTSPMQGTSHDPLGLAETSP